MKILCILDGFGLSDNKNKNAIYAANTKTIDFLFDKYKMVYGNASGKFVGLPDMQMGNSEVGHLNIGAGRIVYQDLTKITKAIDDGDFFENTELLKAMDNCKKNNSNLHIMGLLSDGGVHSHITHLYAIIDMAKREKIKNIYIHCFMDGRDTEPDSGINFIKDLQKKINSENYGVIATISGRYYAMDRDKNYDRVKLAYEVMTNNSDADDLDVVDFMNNNYKQKIYDEFIKPTVIKKNSNIKDNDSIIFYNFRPDRARQITRCFVDDEFNFFDRKKIKNLCFVCFTNYDDSIKNVTIAFKKEDIKNTIGEVISNNGLNQIRIAETEKYAHVTFFLNGGREIPYKNEDRVLIPSPKDVPTYDLKPEMSAYLVLDEVIKAMDSKKYDFLVVNFANPDMVGHTGNFNAAVKAIETVDKCLNRIYDKLLEINAEMFLCADHGNAEKMIDENGNKWTAHTNNRVPFLFINKRNLKLREGGSLCDIAPTILDIMNIEKPKEMLGESLIIKD